METITITQENLAKHLALHAAMVIMKTTGEVISNQKLEMIRDASLQDLKIGNIKDVEEFYEEYLKCEK